MESGDIVNIYQNSLTLEDLDGKARLVKRVPYYGDSRLEQWELVFMHDGMKTVRLICKGAGFQCSAPGDFICPCKYDAVCEPIPGIICRYQMEVSCV